MSSASIKAALRHKIAGQTIPARNLFQAAELRGTLCGYESVSQPQEVNIVIHSRIVDCRVYSTFVKDVMTQYAYSVACAPLCGRDMHHPCSKRFIESLTLCNYVRYSLDNPIVLRDSVAVSNLMVHYFPYLCFIVFSCQGKVVPNPPKLTKQMFKIVSEIVDYKNE